MEAKKRNMKKKSLPLVTKKKNGEIVQEAMETLIQPDKIVEEGHSEQDYNK